MNQPAQQQEFPGTQLQMRPKPDCGAESYRVRELGGLHILVSNAAFQMSRDSLLEVPDEEWDRTIATNISVMFHLCKVALPHLKEGSSIIGSSSVNSDMPSPQLAPYAAVLLASDAGSYVSGARVAVTGGRPIL